MNLPIPPISVPPANRDPRLDIRWPGVWDGLREALAALRTCLPALPGPAAASPLSALELAPRRFRQALVASATLHVLFVVVPLPEFLTRAAAVQVNLEALRIEYDLQSATSLVLPPIAPARPVKRKLSPGGRKNQPVPPRGADVAAPQTIVSNPPQPNHPSQTVIRQFGLERARVEAPSLRLPNLVIPPGPHAAPLTELDLRRLHIPTAPPDATRPPNPAALHGPKSPAQLALREARLENLLPRLAAPVKSGGQDATPAPAVEAPNGGVGGADLAVPGLIALSAQPAAPAPVFELPDVNLRARFTAGPNPGNGSPGGIPGGAPSADGGDGPGGIGAMPEAIVVPGLLVTAGPVPPRPVIVGPGSNGNQQGEAPAPQSSLPTSRSETRERAQGEPASPAKPPTERAEELLQGVGPGTRPTGSPHRVYTIYINMPNLSSQAGSWVLRFAELGETRGSAPGGASDSYPLAAPVPVLKVDPRYPPAARNSGLEGTVFLYGIIRRDGTVENVQVVRSVHELLDASAVAAFQRWRFEPGSKNGAAVNLEVVVEIPFRLSKLL